MNETVQKKVLLACFYHETHTFLSQKTGVEQFAEAGIMIGRDLITNNIDNGSPTDGFLSCAAEQNWEIIPSIQMTASPSGTVTDEAIRFFDTHFFETFELECQNLDGIFLVLHGAMVGESVNDVEGALLKEIHNRLKIKSIDIPVVAVIDLHANVSSDMTDFSTCIYSYRKNPHSDARDSAVDAARLLGQFMDDEQPVSQCHLATRYVIPPTGLGTALDPMKSVQERARKLESSDPDLLCINVMGGYAYADIPDCGFSINCCTRGPIPVAKAYLLELLGVFEVHLRDAYPVEDSLEDVLITIDQTPRSEGPVLLIEPADNIGGGAPGDGTGILGPLLATGRKGIVAIINDAEAAEFCHKVGLDAQVNLRIGAKTDIYHGEPVLIDATVHHISDGKFDLENKKSHLASMMGIHINMGLSAVIMNAQATILLTSRKIPPMDLGQLHSQGITPEKADLIIIKAAVSHKDAYDPIAAASYYIDSDGLCSSNLNKLPYIKLLGKQISVC